MSEIKFRTPVRPLDGWQGTVSHRDSILMLGSCFSDNIGGCLANDLFDVLVNPFGALYNPRSIASAVKMLADGKLVTVDDLFEHNGRMHSFMFHSSFSGDTADDALPAMNTSVERGIARLRDASIIVITLGSARGFMLPDGRLAANCHKLPAERFIDVKMDVDDVREAVDDCVVNIRRVNDSARIIFTVSPIRHTGYGLHGNMLSKAALLLGIEDIVSQHPDMMVYFPAFEIMMDDLRDYRFYADDMKHPSKVAVNYIYDLFSESFMDHGTRAVAAEARNLTRRLSHRPLSLTDAAISTELGLRRRLIQGFLDAHPFAEKALEEFITVNKVFYLSK